MIKHKWQHLALLILLLFAISVLLNGPHRGHDSHTTHETYRIRERIDTVRTVVTVPLAPIRTSGIATLVRTVRIHDTVFAARCFDTLLIADTSAVAPDTISVCVAKTFITLAANFSARRRPVAVPVIMHDTFYSRIDTIQTVEHAAWYEQLLTVLLSVATGVVIGKL